MSNANANNRVAVEVEVRKGQWVRGNNYRSLKEAHAGLDGVCNWRILIEG
jgi:hypothetical protein